MDPDGQLGWAPASYLEPRDGGMDDLVLEVYEEGQGKHNEHGISDQNRL